MLMAMGSGFDQALTKFWDWNNKGVSDWVAFEQTISMLTLVTAAMEGYTA